jgi:phage terminase large subunit-like protein
MGAEIPIAAYSAKQADDTLFGDIVKMVNIDDDLREKFGLSVTKDEIRGPKGGRIFKVTQHGERLDGLNPSLALFDEGHAGASSVYKVIDSAFGARPDQMMRMITTAGMLPEGPAYELIAQAKVVLEKGTEDFSFFAAIYTLDRELYTNPETKALDFGRLLNSDRTLEFIQRCNPMYGVALAEDKVRDSVQEAWSTRIDLRGEVARTRFNIWTSAGSTLIDAHAWSSCYREDLRLEDFIGQKCWIGCDLAQQLDMCAIILLFELPNNTLAIFGEFYLPEDSPTAVHPEIVDYIRGWDSDGHLHLTFGPEADHERVRDDVQTFCDMFNVQMIACDPAQAHSLVKNLWDNNRPVMTYPNNEKTMTGPTDDLITRVVSRRIVHNGNPVLAWHFTNVTGERRGNGSIMPRKDKKNSIRKVDGFVAACFANGCRMQPENAEDAVEKPKVNPYATRGMLGYDELMKDVANG